MRSTLQIFAGILSCQFQYPLHPRVGNDCCDDSKRTFYYGDNKDAAATLTSLVDIYIELDLRDLGGGGEVLEKTIILDTSKNDELVESRGVYYVEMCVAIYISDLADT